MALPPVYTVLIVDAAAPPPDGGAGSPAPGFQWVVTDIVVYNELAAGTLLGGITVFCEGEPGGAIIAGWSAPNVLTGVLYHWTGRQVVQDTQTLNYQAIDEGWTWRVTGFLLSLP